MPAKVLSKYDTAVSAWAEVWNPTNAILRLRPSLVLRTLQSVIWRVGREDWRWLFNLVSSKEGGRFLMHVRVVVVVFVDVVAVGVVMIKNSYIRTLYSQDGERCK